MVVIHLVLQSQGLFGWFCLFVQFIAGVEEAG